MGEGDWKKFSLNGEYPVILALQGGVEGYNKKETLCRKAPPFRAESFTKGFGFFSMRVLTCFS